MKAPTIVRRLANMDPFLAMPIIVLLAIGTIMIYSASSVFAQERYHDSMYFLKRHLFFLTIGLTVMVVGVVT